MTARYEIIRQIASGGMAEVLLARRVDEDGNAQHVVLKRVLPHLSSEDAFLEMFGREARLASELRHPNIVRVLEVGELDGLPFIAMERLEGADLLRLLQQCALRRQPLGTAVALAIVAGAARGLGYAHRARGRDGRALRIIHRDVSPHNLFVTREGGVKLLDFGIAKSAAHVGLTGTGQVKGKISYISPEQIRARPIDARSDLWSLGVVLWEAVAGEKLFTRDNDAATLHAILQDPVPPLMRAEAPGLDELIATILQRDPDHRVGTAEEIANYLDAILVNMRVTQPERVLSQRVAALIPAADPAREFARPAPARQAEVILASSRAAPQRALRADTHPPALDEDPTQTEIGFDEGEHTTAVETSIPDDEHTVAMAIPPADPQSIQGVRGATQLGVGRPQPRHPRLSLEEPPTTPARRAPTMSMPPVGRRAVEPQKAAPTPPPRTSTPPSLPPERPSARPPPTLPPERKRNATALPAEPPRPPLPAHAPAPAMASTPPPMPRAPEPRPEAFQRPAPQDDPFGPLPFNAAPPPSPTPMIAPVMMSPTQSSFAPHTPSGAPSPRGDTLAAAEIPRMVSLPPQPKKSRGSAWMIGVGGVCLLGSALLLGTMGRTTAPPRAASAAVAAPEPTPAPAPAPAPAVAAPEPTPAPAVAAPEPTSAPAVAAPEPAPVVAAPEPTPAPVIAAPEPTPTPAPAPVAAAPAAPRVAAAPRPAAVMPRPLPAAPVARANPAGLAPDPFAARPAAAPARAQTPRATPLDDPFAPRPVAAAARPQPAAPARPNSPVPMDLLPPPAPRAAPTANRRPPRVIDRVSGLTNDPFDTVHGAPPSPTRTARPAPAPAPTRATPAPSARGTQIFTDL